MMEGMSLERTEPFWSPMSTYKLQESIEMGNFGSDRAPKGGECGG